MRQVLAGRLGAIVAREATTGYTGMIKACRLPSVGCVACFTIIGRRKVIDRFSDSWRTGVVVAGEASAVGLGVVEGRVRRPCCDDMAVRAVIRRQEMCPRLAGGGRMAIVMARDARGSGLAVIEGRRCPGCRCVAAVTAV